MPRAGAEHILLAISCEASSGSAVWGVSCAGESRCFTGSTAGCECICAWFNLLAQRAPKLPSARARLLGRSPRGRPLLVRLVVVPPPPRVLLLAALAVLPLAAPSEFMLLMHPREASRRRLHSCSFLDDANRSALALSTLPRRTPMYVSSSRVRVHSFPWRLLGRRLLAMSWLLWSLAELFCCLESFCCL